MTATVIADSPDRGFPWICWPQVTTGTITFAGAAVIGGGTTTQVVTMPSTAWVLSHVDAACEGYTSILTTIQAAFTGVTKRGLLLNENGRVEFQWPGSAYNLTSITFSSASLARRYGFSTTGPHNAVNDVVTSTQDITEGGAWWSPNESTQYVESTVRRVFSSEAPDGAQPPVVVWGSNRKGLLRLEMIRRAYVYDDAAADSRYTTPANATLNCGTLEDAFGAAAAGLPWRVHLRVASAAAQIATPIPRYRDGWISDTDLLRDLRSVATDVDSGRLVTVDIPIIAAAP